MDFEQKRLKNMTLTSRWSSRSNFGYKFTPISKRISCQTSANLTLQAKTETKNYVEFGFGPGFGPSNSKNLFSKYSLLLLFYKYYPLHIYNHSVLEEKNLGMKMFCVDFDVYVP